jgi:hypothetical protein
MVFAATSYSSPFNSPIAPEKTEIAALLEAATTRSEELLPEDPKERATDLVLVNIAKGALLTRRLKRWVVDTQHDEAFQYDVRANYWTTGALC